MTELSIIALYGMAVGGFAYLVLIFRTVAPFPIVDRFPKSFVSIVGIGMAFGLYIAWDSGSVFAYLLWILVASQFIGVAAKIFRITQRPSI